MVRCAETEARFWAIIWESEWREDLEAFSHILVFHNLVNGKREEWGCRLW